eukprot:g6193.t1
MFSVGGFISNLFFTGTKQRIMEKKLGKELEKARKRLSRKLREAVKRSEITKSTLLHYAAHENDVELGHAIVCLNLSNIEEVDSYGETPLMDACRLGFPFFVNFLIKSGASVEAVNVNKVTTLMMASYKGDLETMKILLSHGGNRLTSLKDVWGNTALFYAVKGGNFQAVRYLVEVALCDVFHCSSCGLTALGLAENLKGTQYKRIQAYLKEFMQDISVSSDHIMMHSSLDIESKENSTPLSNSNENQQTNKEKRKKKKKKTKEWIQEKGKENVNVQRCQTISHVLPKGYGIKYSEVIEAWHKRLEKRENLYSRKQEMIKCSIKTENENYNWIQKFDHDLVRPKKIEMQRKNESETTDQIRKLLKAATNALNAKDIELQNLADEKLCIVCLERRRTTLLSPCNHFSLCENCAVKCKSCPVCRSEVRESVRIFLS